MSTFEDEVKLAVEALKAGKTILYPTDTIWGIGCDPTHSKAINKIFKIKKRKENKSLIVLVDSFERLKEYVDEVPAIAADLVKTATKPLTIVYSGARKVAGNLLSKDKTIAIRVTKDPFCIAMIEAFGKAVVSTSANISGEASPMLFSQISQVIRQSVDHTVGLYQNDIRQPKASTMIKLKENGEFEVIRP